MCGIWAYISKLKSDHKLDQFMKNFNILSGRGPDNSIITTFYDTAVIGFHRLSIMDPTDNGNQPFYFSPIIISQLLKQ